ncbi:hypothetical protein D559_0242 [Bordetella holmesii 1058]|uniref:N-acetyltransferase YedL n=1 Tax=Bordetella holmesii 1058 TaxID=1247648 RepID=A0ABN0S471_9BORD|nr:hypothetical protein D559_0242 [Bordetella holmesii 1058]
MLNPLWYAGRSPWGGRQVRGVPRNLGFMAETEAAGRGPIWKSILHTCGDG